MSPAATSTATPDDRSADPLRTRPLRSTLVTGTAALLTLVATLAAGCRGGLGSTCRCAADCRAGLVCRAEGEKALADELCYKPGLSGLCVESEDVDDSGAPVELTDAPSFLDMPSKRDFQPGGSDSVTGTGSTGSTNTTDATSTSTSTGDTSTGTSTSTGDTSTGTSTGGTSTGSTGTSSSSSSSSGSSSSGTTAGSTGASTGSTT